MGALYASGHSAARIAEMIERLFILPRKSSIKDLFRHREGFRFLELIDPHFSLRPNGLLKGEKLLLFLYEQMQVDQFEQLEIPLKVIATDFWHRKQVVFDDGDLLPAVRASMALPYIFTPVERNGRILVDGGLTNNLPFDVLPSSCDIRIAVDVMGERSDPYNKIPSPVDAVFHTYDVMMDALTKEKRRNHPVDIYLHVPLKDVDILDFHKAESIYRQAQHIKAEFKQRLTSLLEQEKPPPELGGSG
jgi:NTE family protein